MGGKFNELTGVVQAGGKSSRMGQDKALMEFLGEPLILRPIRRLAALTDRIIVVTNNPQNYAFLGLPLVSDLLPETGALGGLYTALASASTPLVSSVGCDMPFVSEALLREQTRILLENPRLAFVVPESEHGLEPMHAVYRRNQCLPAVHQALERGERRMISWHDQVDPAKILEKERVRQLDPDGRAFLNLNTREELAEAEELAASENKSVGESGFP